MSEAATPFPSLIFDDTPPWSWPLPPAPVRHEPAPAIGSAQPCRIELQAGTTLVGLMFDFDPAKRRLHFRTEANAQEVSLAFARLRRLTLTAPLQPLRHRAGTPRERVPAAAQERDYRLQQVGDERTPALSGRSAGHVESAEGMFLFTPHGDDGALQRVFVPRTAYTRCEFGASAEELLARHWIASPVQLREAIERQQQQPVLQLGQALLALGLLTPAQLERTLAGLDGKAALGETLVGAGLVSRSDLQTALAHKMGYPLVDVERFPIDPAATAMLPLRLAIDHRVLPLLRDADRLIVAVDRPARLMKLRWLQDTTQLPIVPVLALKSQILLALNRQSGTGRDLLASEPANALANAV